MGYHGSSGYSCITLKSPGSPASIPGARTPLNQNESPSCRLSRFHWNVNPNMNKNTSYLVLLLALGANTLIVELTIPRMIAPVFGNTLFSWTAIIAVVLVALTAGYRVGGFASTRVNDEKCITWISFIAALWVLALSFGGDIAVQQMDWLNMMFGPLIAATLLAFIPAFLDAAVVPLVIQALPGERGEVSGRCFAWSTIGSIIGVLATGYLLLPQFGISGALITGAVLVALALAAMSRFGTATAVGACCTIIAVSVYPSSGGLLVDTSNGYHRIRVIENGTVRSLYLDNTLEGQVRLGDVTPVASYMVKAGNLVQKHATSEGTRPERAFFLGGGSFSIPRYVNHLYPSAEIRVAEVDPEVVRVAKQYLELDSSRIDVRIGDGRQVLLRHVAQYDLVVNDAFQGIRKIPFHLTTVEFNQLVHDRLAFDGIYMINVRGDPANSYLASSFVRTLSKTFPHIYAQKTSGLNIWVIASKKPLDGFTQIQEVGSMAQILTDDHAPVEYLIVRDFVAERLHR